MGAYAAKRALKKWRARAEFTVKCRGMYYKFHGKNDHAIKRDVFYALLSKFKREKLLVMKLHTMTAKYNNKGKLSAFQMIQNFVRSKNDVHAHEKDLSAKNVNSVLTRLYRNRLDTYMTHFRLVTLNGKRQQAKQLSMVKHCLTRSTRAAFEKWKSQAHYATTVIDVNESGPVVEEVLDHQLDVHNLKKLMD